VLGFSEWLESAYALLLLAVTLKKRIHNRRAVNKAKTRSCSGRDVQKPASITCSLKRQSSGVVPSGGAKAGKS